MTLNGHSHAHSDSANINVNDLEWRFPCTLILEPSNVDGGRGDRRREEQRRIQTILTVGQRQIFNELEEGRAEAGMLPLPPTS